MVVLCHLSVAVDTNYLVFPISTRTEAFRLLMPLPQRINVPCGMIYGKYDIVPKGGDLSEYVPNLETITLECGHWIQQEKPDEVNVFLLSWLKRNAPS